MLLKDLQKHRAILILVFLVVVVIVLLLSLIKKGNTSVKIELTVSSVSFNILQSENTPLLNSLSLKVAQLVHFEKLTIPFDTMEMATNLGEENLEPRNWLTVGATNKITISPENEFSSIFLENIRLSELNLQNQSRISLSILKDEKLALKITVEGLQTKGKIIIGDTLKIETQHCEIGDLNVVSESRLNYFRFLNSTSKEIDFKGIDGHFLVSMIFPKQMTLAERNIYVENLSFLERNGKKQLSSIIGPGRIILKDFANKGIDVGTHEFVKIRKSENLQITRISFLSDRIELSIDGRISELKIGTQEHLSNQLPSLLKWIYDHPQLIMIFHTIIIIVTTTVIILHHLRIVEIDAKLDKEKEQ